MELLVALAILAFAFTYGIIHLDGATAPTKLASAGRQLGSQIEFLRGHAIQASRPVEMQIDLDGVQRNGVLYHRFRSVLPPRPSESDADREDAEEILYTDWVSLPKWVNIEGVFLSRDEMETSGILTVRFSPLGEVAPNGLMVRLVSAEILDNEDACFSVELNGLTGEVSYRPGRIEFDQVIDATSF